MRSPPPSTNREESGSLAEIMRYRAPPNLNEERNTIVAALEAADWNKTRAARDLGMSRQTLWNKLAAFADAGRPLEHRD